MPKQLLPTLADFNFIRNDLFRRGFRFIGTWEVRKKFERLAITLPKRKREGPEAGFTYTLDGYTVYVWTTFNIFTVQAKKRDSGWVLITKGDRVVYFATPKRRTKNFVKNLLNGAWEAKVHVAKRPLCEENNCKAAMEIMCGKALGATFYGCRKSIHQGKLISKSWYSVFEGKPLALKHIKARSKQQRKYFAKRRKIGKDPQAARKGRRVAKIGKPENLI